MVLERRQTIPWTERVANEKVPKIVEEKNAAESSCGKTKWDGCDIKSGFTTLLEGLMEECSMGRRTRVYMRSRK